MINMIDKIFNSFNKHIDAITISIGISVVIGLVGALLTKFNFYIIGNTLTIIPFVYLIILLIFTILIGILGFIVFIIKKIRRVNR